MAPTFNFNDLLTEEDFKSERDATLRVKMTQISGLINVDVSIIRSCLSISVQFLKMSCEEDPARYVQTIHDLRQADRTENIPYSQEQLQTLRQNFSSKFLPSHDFWDVWLLDAIEIYKNASAKVIFPIALESCPHPNLALKYAKFLSTEHDEGTMSDTDFRAGMEKLLGTFGFDILSGAELWKLYLEFEIDEFEDSVQVGLNATDIKTLKERFIKLFHRQLSLPLAGNEDTLALLDKLLSEHCTEEDLDIIKPALLNEKYEKSMEMRSCRITYESHLLDEAKTVEEKIASWMTYIRFEINDGQLSRAQRLFERSLLDSELRLNVQHWAEFLEFSLCTLKNWSVVESIASRMLRVVNEDSYPFTSTNGAVETYISPLKRLLWTLRLIATERGTKSTMELINAEVNIALSSRLGQADDYLELLLLSCDASRRLLNRQMKLNKDKIPESIQSVRDSFSYAEVYLSTYYSQWIEGYWQVFKYSSKVEDYDIRIANHGPCTSTACCQCNRNAKEVGTEDVEVDAWQRAVLQFPQSYVMWTEKLNRLKRLQQYEQCSKIFKRLFNNSPNIDVDKVEVVARDWLLFERQFRDLDSLMAAYVVIFPAVKVHVLRSYATIRTTISAVVSTSEPVQAETTSDAKKGKRKLESSGDAAKRAKVVDISDPQLTAVKPTIDSAEANVTMEQSVETVDAAPKYTVQVRNLPFSASESDVEEHLRNRCSSEGAERAVLSCRMLLSKSGTSRGVANIELQSEEDFHTALSLNGSLFQSRQMIVESLQSVLAREAAEALKNKKQAAALKSAGSAPAPHLTTVYVSKLPVEVTDGDLRAHFSSCGSILSAKVSLDKKTGIRKGFGFVQFHDEAAKQAALLLHDSVLQEAHISVTPSRYSLVSPPAVVAPTNNNDSSNNNSDEGNMQVVMSDSTIGQKATNETKRQETNTRPLKTKSTVLAFKPRGMASKTTAK